MVDGPIQRADSLARHGYTQQLRRARRCTRGQGSWGLGRIDMDRKNPRVLAHGFDDIETEVTGTRAGELQFDERRIDLLEYLQAVGRMIGEKRTQKSGVARVRCVRGE